MTVDYFNRSQRLFNEAVYRLRKNKFNELPLCVIEAYTDSLFDSTRSRVDWKDLERLQELAEMAIWVLENYKPNSKDTGSLIGWMRDLEDALLQHLEGHEPQRLGDIIQHEQAANQRWEQPYENW